MKQMKTESKKLKTTRSEFPGSKCGRGGVLLRTGELL